MNAFAYIFTAWVPIFTFPTSKQPYIVTGNYITAGFGVGGALTVLTMRWFHNRDVARKEQAAGTVVEDVEAPLSLSAGEKY